MNEERLPRKFREWYPPKIKWKGRPRNLGMQDVTMREKGINNMEWVNNENGKEE